MFGTQCGVSELVGNPASAHPHKGRCFRAHLTTVNVAQTLLVNVADFLPRKSQNNMSPVGLINIERRPMSRLLGNKAKH